MEAGLADELGLVLSLQGLKDLHNSTGGLLSLQKRKKKYFVQRALR